MNDINDFIRRNLDRSDKEIAALLGESGIHITKEGVRSRRRRMGVTKDNQGTAEKNGLGKLADLLERNNIDVDEIGRVKQVNLWQTTYKDEDGEAQQKDNMGIQFTPKWADGPEWPVVQPAAPVVVKVGRLPKRPNMWGKTCVILPDPQFGFRKFDDGSLDPFHDEKAISIALQVVRDLQPDLIINIGDLLDLAEFSRFVGEASFARTTQISIDRAYAYLATQRALAPNAKIVLFEGNHDLRIQTWIKQNGMAAFGLRRANEPEGWPVMSVPHLLDLDGLGVEYLSGYPASSYYINDRLKVKHGDKTGRRGTVANKVASDEQVSTITGHTHGLEMVYHTVDTLRGPRTRFAATLGCLCRIDGAVPSTKGGIDAFGHPVQRFEDWQQAIGVVTYMDGDNPFDLEKAYIHEGFCLFRGKPYFAEQL